MCRVELLAVAFCAVAAAGVADASDRTARGLARGVQEATISTETPARIIRMPLKDGDAFRKGDLLVEFDCDKSKAEWRAAEAERVGAQATFENSRKLAEYRAAGGHEVQIARAALDKAAAAVEVIVVRLKQCSILAPFDGRLVDVAVREHELPQAGQALLKIVADGRIEVDMIVPAGWLSWLKAGEPFSFASDGGRGIVRGEVIRIGGAIDPVSQTIRAVGELRAPGGAIIPGQSGVIRFGGSKS
jgi:membrane fusion protein, multidrug efflux system